MSELSWSLNESPISSSKANKLGVAKWTTTTRDAKADGDLIVGMLIYNTTVGRYQKLKQLTPSRIWVNLVDIDDFIAEVDVVAATEGDVLKVVGGVWKNAPAPSDILYFPSGILTAGEALNANDFLFISANNQVKKTLSGDSDRKKGIGVIKVAKANGAAINANELQTAGVSDAVFDGTVNAGDLLVMSTGTAGRLVAENTITHNHNFTGNALGTHQHVSWKTGSQLSVGTQEEVPVLNGDGTAPSGNAMRIQTELAGGVDGRNKTINTDAVSAGTPSGSISTITIEHGRVIAIAIEGGVAGNTKKVLITKC
jgi:hypothetical protein